jgi:hypothetical protein
VEVTTLKEIAMNVMSKPFVALLAATVLIGASMLSPAVAASKARAQHVRTSTMVEQPMAAGEYATYNQFDNASSSNERRNPRPYFAQDDRCFIDLGQGRWMECNSP